MTNVMIVGVGGQGSLLASRIIGTAASDSGYNVKMSEVHGMSQRGGSVTTYIRYGKEEIYSPVICRGEADIIISFELLEAARNLPFLKKGGRIVTATREIMPLPVIIGASKYPENLVQKLKDAGAGITVADTETVARQAGSEKTANVALIGYSADFLKLDEKTLRAAVEKTVPEKFRELNLKAFDLAVAAHRAGI